MSDVRTETWQEIKNGLGVCFKILIYSVLGLAFCAGVGYVCIYCCQ